MYERIVLVTRKTRLMVLKERFGTRGQAQFYIEQNGGSFADYAAEDEAYEAVLGSVRRQLEIGLQVQVIDRSYVPNYQFRETDLVVTLGQDGLVANTAKYVGSQPLIGVNPDRERFDGVLLPFDEYTLARAIGATLAGHAQVQEVTLAQATLNDGRSFLAFNDFFVGAATHVSARYIIITKQQEERQSSSGVIISTGAGSTGWMSSLFHQANGFQARYGKQGRTLHRQLGRSERKLLFAVREPFASRTSGTSLIVGELVAGDELQIVSEMPTGGVLFSDGMVNDYVPFNAGTQVSIGISPRVARLVVPSS